MDYQRFRFELLHFRRDRNKFTQLMNDTNFTSVIFDFDSTLSSIDGIEFLAELKGVTDEVKSLAVRNENTFSVSSDLYRRRLDVIRPHNSDIQQLTSAYKQHLLPGVDRIIHLLHRFKKDVYIISGGIRNALVPAGESVGVRAERIFGVKIYFDDEGNMSGFEEESPLTDVQGKKHVIASLPLERPCVFIGDGTNDLAASEVVNRFVGFGGVEYRPLIEEQCKSYIRHQDITRVLPAILTREEMTGPRENEINHLVHNDVKPQEV